MKKIAIVANSTWNIFNFRLQLIRHFQSKGYDVIIISPTDKYTELLLKDNSLCHIPLFQLAPQSKNPICDISLLRELFTIYKKEKPDLIFHYTIKPNIFGSVAARWADIPCISTVTGLGYTFLNQNIFTRLVKPLYKFAFSSNYKILFHNHDDQSLFEKLNLIKKGSSAVVKGSGVDTNFFSPMKKSGNEKFIFLFIGRLLYDKGIVEFLNAAKLIRKKNKEIKCWVVGELNAKNPSNVPKEELDQFIKNGDIQYFGTIKDVRKFIKEADVVVLPSYREGMPRAVLEGMAMGKPIITTDTAGCRESITDGENGYLVPIKNAKALADAFQKMYNLKKETLAEMGNKSREKALKEFDVKIINQKYLEFAKEVFSTNEFINKQ